MKLDYCVKEDNLSINQILKSKLNISSRLCLKLIKNNRIFLNNEIINTRNICNIGDILTIDFDYNEDISSIIPSKMNLDILYEDDWLLVINKPAGIATHPSILHYDDSLCNGVRYYFDKINLRKKARPVNRLDLNTSGIIVFAKCEYIQECLISQMKQDYFSKEYIAICEGFFLKKKRNYK